MDRQQLVDDWTDLFDRHLRDCQNSDVALARKCFEQFQTCAIVQAMSADAQTTLQAMIGSIQRLYLPNAYHSFFHATHVVLSCALLARSLAHPLLPNEHFCLLFAALIHDIGHEGVFNSTLIAEAHETALLYNDVSCAEMKSTATGLDILKSNATALGISDADHADMRKRIIDLVLQTDLADPWRGKVKSSLHSHLTSLTCRQVAQAASRRECHRWSHRHDHCRGEDSGLDPRPQAVRRLVTTAVLRHGRRLGTEILPGAARGAPGR